MSKTYIQKALRERVTEQAKHCCGYCLTHDENAGAPMEIEHIIPEAAGGLTEESNLWLACKMCNDYKGDRMVALDEQTGEIVPLFHPRQQRWEDHFSWTEQWTVIVGLTPVGRAAVAALNLNRPLVVRARQRWVQAGGHPPKD